MIKVVISALGFVAVIVVVAYFMEADITSSTHMFAEEPVAPVVVEAPVPTQKK